MKLSNRLRPDALESQLYNTKNGFTKNTAAHLGGSFGAIGKNNGHFNNVKTKLPGRVFHLNLKSVTGKFDFTKIDGIQ